MDHSVIYLILVYISQLCAVVWKSSLTQSFSRQQDGLSSLLRTVKGLFACEGFACSACICCSAGSSGAASCAPLLMAAHKTISYPLALLLGSGLLFLSSTHLKALICSSGACLFFIIPWMLLLDIIIILRCIWMNNLISEANTVWN